MRQIVIEAETPHDFRTMFRLRLDKTLIAEGLTAVQAHILVGEILEQIALPKPAETAKNRDLEADAQEIPMRATRIDDLRRAQKEARAAVGRAVKNAMRGVELATLPKEVRRIIALVTGPRT